jgi:hypothetical protein
MLRVAPRTRSSTNDTGGYSDGNRDRLLLTDQHHEALSPSDRGVEQVPLQHRVMLCQDRNHDGGILRPLALVDRRRVCRNEGVEFPEAVANRSTIENGAQFTGIRIDILDSRSRSA